MLGDGTPNLSRPRALATCGMSIVAVLAAIMVLWMRDTHWRDGAPVALLLLAVIITARSDGTIPGLLAAALSVLPFGLFFATPGPESALGPPHILRMTLLIVLAALVLRVTALERDARTGLVEANVKLNAEVVERRRVVEELRQREAFMQALADNANDFIRLDDIEGRTVYASPSVERLYGKRPTSMFEFAHPDDLPACRRWWERAVTGTSERLEWRIIDRDGNVCWMETSASSLQSGGRPYILTVCRDITDRKREVDRLEATSQQFRALTARVQSAREEEDRRIGREIHDELGAALTSFRWDLEEIDEVIGDVIGQSTEASRLTELRDKVGAAIQQTDSAIDTVRRITSELRPTALDELGLADALRWHARQFQARTGIAVHCDDLPERIELTDEQATAVFRIVQETLTNVLRHAQARSVDLRIEQGEGDFILTIRDDGRGITDAEKAAAPPSLGLLGMRERAYLLGGDIRVEGIPGQGTTVILRFNTHHAEQAAKDAEAETPDG